VPTRRPACHFMTRTCRHALARQKGYRCAHRWVASRRYMAGAPRQSRILGHRCSWARGAIMGPRCCSPGPIPFSYESTCTRAYRIWSSARSIEVGGTTTLWGVDDCQDVAAEAVEARALTSDIEMAFLKLSSR